MGRQRRAALTERRIELGLTKEDVAVRLGRAVRMVERYESGDADVPEPLWRRYAEILEWTPRQFAEALRSTPAGLEVVEQLSLYVELEQAAARAWAFEPYTVYALLQTEEYATAVESTGLSASRREITRRVQLRMARQAVLDRQHDPLDLAVVLDESVLHRVPGGNDKVMAEQLAHLVDIAERPNIDLRVLLNASSVHAAESPFTLLRSSDTAPVRLCLFDRTGFRPIEQTELVDRHMAVFDHLTQAALPPSASIDYIRTIAKERRQ